MIFFVLAIAFCVGLLRMMRTPVGQDMLPELDSDTAGYYTDGDAYDDHVKFPPKETDRYLLGVGKADITGPVVEINMMGYANTAQVGSGVKQRLYSRAFIVGDIDHARDRFVYLVLDTQSGDTAVRYGILKALKERGPEYAMYTHDNLAVTATHSHSGPGAWLNYLLPQITSLGFDKQSYQAIVDGCVLSIVRAHESLSPGKLSVGSTKVLGANINRSLYSYLANPEEERARYNISSEDDGSVEKDMTLLGFKRESDGKNIGILSWFPTHGTSMTVNNTLITGDNKGLAADLFEKAAKQLPDASDDFVAGFSQANMGDASPNTLGAWCDDGSGERCDFKASTCRDGRPHDCHARGPKYFEGNDEGGAASCMEIARLQHEAAWNIFTAMEENGKTVNGVGVKAVHEFHNMAFWKFDLPDGTEAQTCPAALGYSFGGGTWDEPGHFDITQQSTEATVSFGWRFVRWLLRPPSKEQTECQQPKSIILDVGEASKPYQWTPNVVDIQTFRVGQLIMVISPGEATTMAGRRWKEAVAKHSSELLKEDLAGQEPIVVIGAPSNSYTHYITTQEEYGIQRYEGASTLYGPHTLAAYINRTAESLHFLGATKRSPRHNGLRILPPDNSQRSISFISGVVFDRTGSKQPYGATLKDVDSSYRRGETANATFIGANPRNNLRLEDTFAAVEFRRSSKDEWKRVRDDSDWNLVYRWKRISSLLGTSQVTVDWEIEEDAPAGEYRLAYFGDAKALGGKVTPFKGVSSVFTVKP